MKKRFDDPVLERLKDSVERSQAELWGYLQTGNAPERPRVLIDPDLVPIADLKPLLPLWSLATIRRVVARHGLGRKDSRGRQLVYLSRFRAYLEREGLT
jgi:hypothetical protein